MELNPSSAYQLICSHRSCLHYYRLTVPLSSLTSGLPAFVHASLILDVRIMHADFFPPQWLKRNSLDVYTNSTSFLRYQSKMRIYVLMNSLFFFLLIQGFMGRLIIRMFGFPIVAQALWRHGMLSRVSK